MSVTALFERDLLERLIAGKKVHVYLDQPRVLEVARDIVRTMQEQDGTSHVGYRVTDTHVMDKGDDR